MTEEIPAVSEPTKGSGKRLLIIGAAAGLVIGLVGVGAFAWQKLSGGGTQPHDVLPSTVVAYARIDADPSASQKIAILRLIRKFPELAKELGIKDVDQDIRKPLLEDLVGECDLDYDKDVEPWIGNRIGVAYDSDLETPIVAVQISDEGKARIGITSWPTAAARQQDRYRLPRRLRTRHPEKGDAAKVSAAAEKKSLADNTTLREGHRELGEQGVFSAWADSRGHQQDGRSHRSLRCRRQRRLCGRSHCRRHPSRQLVIARARLDRPP